MSFQIGDVVVLNSGSPNLTVVSKSIMSADDIQVAWIDDEGKKQTAIFPEVCFQPWTQNRQ